MHNRMIRIASVLFFGLVFVCLGVTPTFAATVLPIEKVSGDGQKITVPTLPATFPTELRAQFPGSGRDQLIAFGKPPTLDWSIDPTNNSAKCKISTMTRSELPFWSAVTVTAAASGTCVVNVVGPLRQQESFNLAITYVPLTYTAKIMFGNYQTATWPAIGNIQNGGDAYFSSMEVQLVDRSGNPASGVEVDWECGAPRELHCIMKLPMIMGILGQMGEMTHTDSSGKADLPTFILMPSGAPSPLVTNNARGAFTVTADSPRGLFAPVVFNMTVK